LEDRTLSNGTHDGDGKDAPLPATLAFVMTMGSLFFIGWFLMFWLLSARF
jgi:hypothetical protein